MYEFSGKVHEVCDVQTFSSGFSKRELIVEEDGRRQYPNHVTFNFKRENASKLDGVKVGDRVTVTFELDGRSWVDPRTNKERHFSDLVGLAVRVEGKSRGDFSADMPPAADPVEDAGEECPF